MIAVVGRHKHGDSESKNYPMRRRLVFLLPIAAAGWLKPLRVLGQNASAGSRRLGIVHVGARSDNGRLISAFFDRLRELGWIDGRNLFVEARWTDGKMIRLTG